MSTQLDRRLLRVLRDRAPKAVHAGEVVTRAGLSKDEFDSVLDALARLREAGMAMEMPGRRFRFVRDTPLRPSNAAAPRRSENPSAAREREPSGREPVGRTRNETRERSAPRDGELDVRDRPAPREREREPVGRERTAPREREREPVGRERTAPREREREPVGRERTAPREREREPVGRERTAPREREREPVGRERTAPREREREPVGRERTAPREREREPVGRERTAPREREREPVGRERTAPRGREREQVGRERGASFAPPQGRETGRYSPPPRDMPTSLVRGVLSIHARGFGFVTADDGGAEVFVPPTELGPAMHGDRVEVEARPSVKGREGRIVGIAQRRRARLVGAVHADYARGQVFMPGDPRLAEMMRILEALPEGIAVGDAVVAEIREFPQSSGDIPGVVVVERLGSPGELKVEVARILARDGVVEDFPDVVVAEARLVPKKVSEEEAKGRRDLRDVPLATIDPDDARDHDDALYGERLPDGGFRLVIAIADVSHYVRPGTAIDSEALARATTIYLPDRAIPMLPREISSKIASLLPGEDRLCMGVEVELGPEGGVRNRSFFEGVMRSRARITYGGAARTLGLTKLGRKQKEAEALLPSLTALLEASRKLRSHRDRRGSLDFDLPEAKVELGDDGQPTDVVESRRDPGVREAYRLVEEMMLLANELVAEHLTHLGLPGIHRIHPPPEEKRIELFCQLAQSLGHDLDAESAGNPRVLARFLAKTADAPEAPFLRFLLLRAMQQASYSLDSEIGHFGLGARHYLHFTSPIRRYPDLAVHRVLRAHLRKEAIDRAALVPKLRLQASESSRLERRAMTIDREVVDVYEIVLMRDRIGDVYEGQIASVESDRFTVRLTAPFVDVVVELERLGRDRYELDSLGLRLASRSGHSYGMGDPIRVQILEANLATRRILALPVEEPGERERTPRRPKSERRSSSDGAPTRSRVDSPKEGRRRTKRR